MTKYLCPERVWEGFSSYVCDRPVKRNGYCGIHARMHEKRAERDQRWEKRRQEIKQSMATNEERVAKLEQEFGIELAWCVDGLGSDEPRVDMHLEDLEEILRKVSGKESS